MGLFDMFGGGNQHPYQLYDPEQFAARNQDINSFQNHLDTLSQQYKDSLKNFYGTAFNLGSQNLASNFGGGNFSLNGGAFQGALARLASGYTAEMLPKAYEQDISNTNNVFGARTGLFNTEMNLGAEQNKMNTDYRLGNEGALGSMALRTGVGFVTGGGVGALAGAAGFNPLSLFGGGGGTSPSGGAASPRMSKTWSLKTGYAPRDQ